MNFSDSVRSYLSSVFAADLRSLAALRIGAGAMLVTDLLNRMAHLSAHYTDMGMMPRSVIGGEGPVLFRLSLYMISGDKNVVVLLFLLQLVVAVGLLVGFRTRLVTALSWVLLLSLHNRNPMLQYGGDQVLLLTLFWGMFLPWGRRWSADNAAQADTRDEGNLVFSIATSAYLIQVCLIFFTAGLLKSGPEWTDEFTAVYYALANYEYQTPLGTWLLHAGPGILKMLTVTTLLAEMGLPLLLFLPRVQPFMRMIFFFGILPMQLGFGLSLTLGIFPFISTIVCLGLLPGEFWDLLAPGLTRLRHRLEPRVMNLARKAFG